MKTIAIATISLLFASQSVLAAVNGPTTPSGYYWQTASNGKLLCRKVGVAKFQPHKNCKDAGAELPK